MEVIQAFQKITIELIELLQQENLDRDEKNEKIQNLLDKRDEFLTSIQPPFTPEEKELGRRLVQLDQQVHQLLQKQKRQIQHDIAKLRMKKKTTQKYINPYESIPVDGLFLDKQK